jgi:hypothetical protein
MFRGERASIVNCRVGFWRELRGNAVGLERHFHRVGGAFAIAVLVERLCLLQTLPSPAGTEAEDGRGAGTPSPD